MTNANKLAQTNEKVKSNQPDAAEKQKQPVDVATLEKSKATSEIDTESSAPIAAGEASG